MGGAGRSEALIALSNRRVWSPPLGATRPSADALAAVVAAIASANLDVSVLELRVGHDTVSLKGLVNLMFTTAVLTAIPTR